MSRAPLPDRIEPGPAPDGHGSAESPLLWRSWEELADAPELRAWLEAEFPEAARGGAVDRRAVLRLLSASFAAGGLAACGDGPIRGAPLFSQPRSTPRAAPGETLEFATSLELGGYGLGVLVQAQDGRPSKVEGNPLHPASLGATDVFAQAAVLSLFDPGRPRTPAERGVERSWGAFEAEFRSLAGELAAGGGKGLHILMAPVASPTLQRLVAAARERHPAARWHLHSPVHPEREAWAGARQAFGRPLDTVYDLTAADLVLTLGGDLFLREPGHIRYAADYVRRRRESGFLGPRLVAAETTPSLVGAKADERLALPPAEIAGFARALALSLAAPGTSPDGDEPHPAAARLAAELKRAGPRALVAVGREQPAVVHALAHAINATLGSRAVRYIEPLLPEAGSAGYTPIGALAGAIASGEATHVLVLGGNPAYDAPADLDLAALLRRVPHSLYLGEQRNETALACRWFAPLRHALEGWGDLRAFDGVAGLRQPATVPLAPALSVEEALADLAGEPRDPIALVQATWRHIWGGDDFEARWLRALEAGVVDGTGSEPVSPTLRAGWDPGPTPRASGLAAVFAPDASVWDGRFADNAWLQELPRPLTKQVWGNAALIAPELATKHGLRTGDVVALRAGARAVEAPVWVLPGHAPGAVTLPLGYGRSEAGRVGTGIGFDAYALRSSERPWMLAGVEITPTGRRQELIGTQHHHALPQDGDSIVRVVGPAETAAPEHGPQPSLYPEYAYEGRAWAMTVDLDACIGCNACVIACQVENNVPVVGPEEAARGREMHWLRVDRYYGGDSASPSTYFQPVPCMHCEKAPCELVCPVNATVHSAEGLNEMVYNRCIGTRTCSNNCPYKVRRFNFFDYRAHALAPADEALSPHVSIRERGVMEKCTYCVQRIQRAGAAARLEGRTVRDGEVVTACQQACPTQAIVFGDQNDPASAVVRLKRSPRNYALLGRLNTQPRTTYLARVAPAPADRVEGG